MRNILKCIAIGAVVVLTGCSTSNNQTSVVISNEVLSKIDDGMTGLRNYDKNYMVSVGIEMPNSAKYYLECNDTANSYTQYSVSPEGVLGDIPYERADNTQFMLYDWVTSTKQGYLLNQSQFADSTAEKWLVLPESYSEGLLSRRVLYMDKLLSESYDFVEDTPKQIDFGSGIVTMQVYKGKVHSSAVKEVLGYDSLGLYTVLREEAKSKSDDNMLNLLDIYISDLDMDYTFSDGILEVGVYDGILRYFCLEVGGLGNRLTYTKTVLDFDSALAYDIPVFNSTKSYYAEIKEMADYVAKYDSYDEAMKALSNNLQIVSGDAEDEPTDSDTATTSLSEANDTISSTSAIS